MTTIVDAVQSADGGAAAAPQGRDATELEARVDGVARTHIEELGRLIEEANKTTEYNEKQRRERPLAPEAIAARKARAITYYTIHADALANCLTAAQCVTLLKIASANRNFLPIRRLLSDHQGTLQNEDIVKYATELTAGEFSGFLKTLEITKFFALYSEFTKRPALKQALLARSLEILALNNPHYNQNAYEPSFALSLEINLEKAIDLVINQGRFSRTIQIDITNLSTRLRNTANYDLTNKFLTDLQPPLFNQAFPQLFQIFSNTFLVKRVLFERALAPQSPPVDLFTPDSYKNALDFFLTNDLNLAEHLILEKVMHSATPDKDIINFVRRIKAADEARAIHFVQTLPAAHFAHCWEDLFTVFQNDPTTFNSLVNRAITNGLLTDATLVDGHKRSFDLVFATWMANPAHRPEAINLFRLLEGSLSFYNSFSDSAGVVRARKSTWARVDFDVAGTRNTALNILQVDCHQFPRNTALIQLYSTLNALPRGTRVLWVHGAGHHSAPGAQLLGNTVPTLWASLRLPIQLVGSQLMGARTNLGATVVEKT